MSSWRCYPAARLLAVDPPRLRAAFHLVSALRARCLRARCLRPPGALAIALLVGGCSSAGDTGLVGTGTMVVDTGVSASDSAVSAGSEAHTAEAADTDASTSGSDPGDSADAESSEPTPEVPPAEPTPEDVIDAKGIQGGDSCDLQTPVSVTLRTLDAAATVSPTQARDAALSGWVSLTGIRIRPWEFFNYYAFDYPAAEPGTVAIWPQLAVEAATLPSPEFVLQIGVSTQALTAEQRPPVHLTLALDNSNSMAGKAQDMQRATAKALADHLRQGDIVSIVTWNAKNATILDLHAVTGPGDPVILEKLDALELGGSAELYSGLMSAYKMAEAGYDPAAWNRVLLVSDGGATANETDLAVIREHADKQIYLSGVGVGEAGIYRSDMIDAAAHAGRGASLFIGSEAEADKRFGQQLTRTLGAAVRDVEVRLDLPPGFEVVRDLQDPLNGPGVDALSVRLGPNTSLVLHRRLRSCDPGATTDTEAKLLVRVTFIDELTGELKEVKSAVQLSALLADKSVALYKGAAVAAYAAALQRWQARPADLLPALEEATARLNVALQLLPTDPELAEIAAVLAVLGAG